MPTLQIETQFSTDELLNAVKRLSLSDLEELVSRMLLLRAQLIAPHVSKDEAELLRKINEGVPSNIQTRYNELAAKRDTETLSPQEYDKLLKLTDKIEKVDVERLEDLIELARIRNTSLDALMQELGIKTPDYA